MPEEADDNSDYIPDDYPVLKDFFDLYKMAKPSEKKETNKPKE